MSSAVCGDSAVYWLWLQQRMGFASRYACAVLEQPGTARFIYERSEDDLWALGLFPPYIIERLCDKSLDSAKTVIKRCEELGILIFTPDDSLYPQRLLNIFDPPLALFVLGNFPKIDDELCLAVVGTRTASAFGAAMAQDIGERFTDAGCLIISGAARGIDTAAHQGALMHDYGRTVAVLGCGINHPYNKSGESLRDIITRNGALVSEYTPDFPPSPHTFPIRNRIISGLSLGVLVVEAGFVSGSINTAYTAINQSRDVFVVSPSIAPYNSAGGKRLLSEGARSVSCPLEILETYAGMFSDRMHITTECSRNFLYNYTRDTFTHSLSDVFNHFIYVFSKKNGNPPPHVEDCFAMYTESVKTLEEKLEDPPDGRYTDNLYDDYFIDYSTVINDENAISERLVDRLWGEFVPSWRIPVPDGFPEDDDEPVTGVLPDPHAYSEPRGAGAHTEPDTKQKRSGRPAAPQDTTQKRSDSPAAPQAAENEAFGMALDEELSEDAGRLLSYITSQPRSADELTALSGFSRAKLMSLLTELELFGLIAAHSGKRYSLSE